MYSILSFPSWVPLGAREKINELCADPTLEPEHRVIVNRLAADLRMQTVWNVVARAGPGKEADVIRLAMVRATQALGHQPPFPRRRKDQSARILADAMALRRPNAKPYDLDSTAAIASMLVDAMRSSKPTARMLWDTSIDFEQLHMWAVRIAEAYRSASAQHEELMRQWALPSIGKAASENAPERLFTEAITGDFKKLFARPLNEAVAALTSVVFNSDGPGSATVRGRQRSAVQRNIRAKNRKDVPRRR